VVEYKDCTVEDKDYKHLKHHGLDQTALPTIPTRFPTKYPSATTTFDEHPAQGFNHSSEGDHQTHTGSQTVFSDVPTKQPTNAPTNHEFNLNEHCMNGDVEVPVGWHGAGNGTNFCNLCKCTSNRASTIGSTNGVMKCQQKNCNAYQVGAECKATTCRFVYQFATGREIMKVTHNNMDGAYNKEETMGSHHRCAYYFTNKTAAVMRTSTGKQWPQNVATQERHANHCRCMCYKPNTSRFQKDVRRKDTPNDFNNLNTTHVYDSDYTGENHDDIQSQHDAHDSEHRNNRTYWVGPWGNHTATWGGDHHNVTQQEKSFGHLKSLSSSAPTKFPTKTPPTPHAATPAPTLYPTFDPTSYPTPVPTYNNVSDEKVVNDFITEREISLGLVKANVSDGTANDITTALDNEFDAWKGHTITLAKHDGNHHALRTWQGNMVKFTLMKAGIDHFFHGGKDNTPLFLEGGGNNNTVFDLYAQKKQEYMKIWFKHIQNANVGPPTADNTYHCMAYNAQSRDDNGGYADPTVIPATCATVDENIQNLTKIITKSVDAEVWHGQQ
jgi:hypothetical protein